MAVTDIMKTAVEPSQLRIALTEVRDGTLYMCLPNLVLKSSPI
jgi:hypothetical protein